MRLDFAFNGGGSELYKADNNMATDPLAAAFADPPTRNAFGCINHTYDHPNIDCSTASFITKEITDNVAWGRQHGLPLDPTEVDHRRALGPGEHAPGQPGHDRPAVVRRPDARRRRRHDPGRQLRLRDLRRTSRRGGDDASVATGSPSPPAGRVTATFNAVCHAIAFNLYRGPAGATSWTLVGTLPRTAPTTRPTTARPRSTLSITDTGAAGTARAPPAANGAALAPYGQNPNYLAGTRRRRHQRTSRPTRRRRYPTIPTDVTSAQYPAGASVRRGQRPAGFQAVPRYPSNVYYNVSRQGQQLDEYNWIYVAPANGGGCVPIAGVTTCRTTPATWADYVTSENTIMFRHVMGNDPRPHFMHQSNLADYNPALPETDPNQGGILYPVIDGAARPLRGLLRPRRARRSSS